MLLARCWCVFVYKCCIILNSIAQSNDFHHPRHKNAHFPKTVTAVCHGMLVVSEVLSPTPQKERMSRARKNDPRHKRLPTDVMFALWAPLLAPVQDRRFCTTTHETCLSPLKISTAMAAAAGACILTELQDFVFGQMNVDMVTRCLARITDEMTTAQT